HRQPERRQAERTEAGLDPAEVIAEAIDQATIVEGVDELIEVQRAIDQGPRTAADRALVADDRAAGLSREALARFAAVSPALRTGRSGTGPLSSIIRTAMAETGIDSDIWGLNGSLRNLHRSAVDSFLSAASQYATTDDQPTITGFLS